MRTLFYKPILFERFDRESFGRRLSHHLRRWGIVYLLLIVAAALFQAHYAVGLNVSPSLPQRFFLIHKGELPLRGHYVAFRWPGGGPYPAGVTFVKIIAGMTGDAVTRRMGLPLEPGPTGILPAGRYYVRAPHPDSLDSRYRLTGWISDAQIIGRAYALF